MSEHGEGTFENGGAAIFEQWWRPDGEPRAVVAICHGYAEHGGRYAQVAADLNAAGFAVEALDLRGHGRSSGERVTVSDYEEWIGDLAAFVERVRGRNPGKKVFLLGHSMGGGVSTAYVLSRKPALDGVILSGAGMLGPRPAPPPEGTPPAAPQPLPAYTISRDPAVVEAYEKDPLVYRGPRPANMAAVSKPAYEMVQREMDTFAYPLLLIHGTEDLLVAAKGSEILHERAASTDKTLKLYPGLYHEVLNEPERDQVVGDVVAWLNARTS
ncbi:MAG: lysophospholipase [Dehalococcoidia bacterium]|nr:lysophospholipase [Dehalococcoidia bacterium]